MKGMNLEDLSDERLVELAKKNGKLRNVVGILYFRHKGGLMRILSNMVKDEELAKELIQETFLRVQEKVQSYDPTRGRVSTWLYTIGIRLGINHLRTRKKRNYIDVTEMVNVLISREPSPEKRVYNRERAEIVNREVGKLSKDFRDVVNLRYHGDLDYEKIAEILGLKLGTMKSRIYRARELLKPRLNAILNS